MVVHQNLEVVAYFQSEDEEGETGNYKSHHYYMMHFFNRRRDDYYGGRDQGGQSRGGDYDYYSRDTGGSSRGGDYYDYFYRRSPPPPAPPRDPYYYDRGDPYYRGNSYFHIVMRCTCELLFVVLLQRMRWLVYVKVCYHCFVYVLFVQKKGDYFKLRFSFQIATHLRTVMRLKGTVHPQTVMLLRQNEIVMPLHPIVIGTHHHLIAMIEELVAVVAIVTAILEIIMTQEETMTPVVITAVRGMDTQLQGTVVSVVERWIKTLTDQEEA